mgnify:CR=1 FL=1
MKFKLIILLAALPVSAHTMEMNTDQYIEYMAQQHCANQKLWQDPDKLNAKLAEPDKQYGVDENDFDALDQMAMDFTDNADDQEKLEQRVKSLCP